MYLFLKKVVQQANYLSFLPYNFFIPAGWNRLIYNSLTHIYSLFYTKFKFIGIVIALMISLQVAAITRQDSLVQLLESSEGIARSEVLNQLSASIYAQNPDKAIELASEALEIAVENNNLLKQADAFFNIAQGYRSKGENVKSLDYYLKAEKTYRKVDNAEGMAKSRDNSGRIYRFLGDYSTALEHHLKALKIYMRAVE